jgi:hypothetical protein
MSDPIDGSIPIGDEQESPPQFSLNDAEGRLKRMTRNCVFLMAMIDSIHDSLCPKLSGTWQQRAEQARAAALKLAGDKS